MRECRVCSILKPISEFNKNTRYKDGYDTRCKVCNNAATKEWYAANTDRVAEAQRQRNQENPEPHRQQQARWQRQNRGAVNDYRRGWRQDNRDKEAGYKHKRRGAIGVFTDEDIKNLYLMQDSRCYYCKCDISSGYHVEHKQPIARGGSNWPENIALSCPSCNLEKGSKTEEEYIEYAKRH